MQIELELLAPAKNKSIGIAAIDCGADAVYIAGPRFGAREAAGNTLADIAELVDYAHKFGAKVYMVVNTILYEDELQQARETIIEAHKIGCDAIIVQDLAIMEMDLPPIELFASTQTNIRTPQQARFLESLGFSRLILARELSLEQIAAIKEATNVPLESFIHGALCVSYSGQCYLSQKITGRSANRGCCAQACRTNYTLADSTGREVKDASGNPLAKDIPVLSLKDFNLSGYIPQLVEAGITSFKIEGRLKNESYIRNTVLLYRREIDEFLKNNSRYKRASYGQLNFTYRLENGKQPLNNGDGLCFVTPAGEILGARANACNGNMVATTEKLQVPQGSKIYRNYNIAFEKEMEKNPPKRMISVNLAIREDGGELYAIATTAEGIGIRYNFPTNGDAAQNKELAKENIRKQLGKSSGIFSFQVEEVDVKEVPFLPAAQLNGIRREIALALEEKIAQITAQNRRAAAEKFVQQKKEARPMEVSKGLTYLANCSNSASRQLYTRLGAEEIAPAYELQEAPQAELMRTKYCIKYEFGLCPNYRTRWAQDKNYRNNLGKITFTEPLFLINGRNRLQLKFDCANCEMLVIG